MQCWTDEALDNQNQQKVELLSDKVSRLKSLAFDIETESKDSNRYIDSMDGDFDSTTGLLSGSMKRVSHMVNAGKGNRRLMCYIIIGLVLLFFFTYYVISRVTAQMMMI
ncbi:hypothetical protein ScPMuIL_016347 [Solemya velum]